MAESNPDTVTVVQNTSMQGQRPPRPGSYVAAAPGRRLVVPDVKIRCSAQQPGTPPVFARPRFTWSLTEASGALGDLGTFLPHIIGAITVTGMNPTGVLIAFGLFYLASGAVFGVPLGVQPMKAASAAILIQRMTPGEVAGAGLVIGAIFLLAGLTGVVTRIARVMPQAVTAGIQLGLGLSLTVLGVELIREEPWLGLMIASMMLALLNNRRLPAALIGLAGGVLLARVAGITPGLPSPGLGLHLPALVRPSWDDLLRGTELAVLPQIPLTLTNAIIVTAAMTRQLFPKELHHASERNLAISTGLGNLIAAPLGGYPMCHGAGGIAGHYRFGARSATAPLLIGVTFLALGLLLGEGALPLLALIPSAVVGSLLFFSGLELALASRPQDRGGTDAFVMLVVAAVAVAYNPAVAFVVGLALMAAVRRGLVRL